jgi:hypothetical protein
MLESTDAAMQLACELYLDKKPFQGKVPDFKHKTEVKELCRGPGPMGWKAVHWDATNKLWGTMNIENVPKLLCSGKWEPVGIQQQWYGCLLQMAKEKSNAKDKAKTQKQESKMAAISDQNEKERIEALEQRKKREAEQQERNKLKSMRDSTEDELKRVHELGFDLGVPEYALRLEAAFGPIAGMSPCGRVLRWLGFKMTAARFKAYSETGAAWMAPDDLLPYYDAARRSWVQKLNEAAKRGTNDFDDPSPSKRSSKSAVKRARYEDVDTGDAIDKTTRVKVDTLAARTSNKETVNVQPSFANYKAFCTSCYGTISAQFRECMCSSDWVPCYGCCMFVASHQKCQFGHTVQYCI